MTTMPTKRRWMISAIAEAKSADPRLPWQRKSRPARRRPVKARASA